MLLRVIGALLPQIVSRLLDISEAVLMTGSGSDRKTGAASPRLKIAGSSGGMRRCTRTERRWCGTAPKVMRTMSNVAASPLGYWRTSLPAPSSWFMINVISYPPPRSWTAARGSLSYDDDSLSGRVRPEILHRSVVKECL